MKPSTPSLPPAPLKMRDLPRDRRGYPVPAMVQYDAQGRPQFPVIDMAKWHQLAVTRCCGICGKPMHQGYWFVGGPLSIENRTFTDLPMHRECAEFSLKVCPFLAMPRYRYIEREVTLPDGMSVNVNESVSTRRPERFGLARAPSYRTKLIVGEQGAPSPVLFADPFERVLWWQQGRQLMKGSQC